MTIFTIWNKKKINNYESRIISQCLKLENVVKKIIDKMVTTWKKNFFFNHFFNSFEFLKIVKLKFQGMASSGNH